MLAKVNTITNVGLDGRLVEVEADMSNGLPAFIVVGLANKAVDEAKERVRSAIKNSRLNMPPRRITLNLAPADLPKTGSGFDLAMAVSLLVSSKQINSIDNNMAFVAELSLDGKTRSVPGALSAAQACSELGITQLFVAEGMAKQAALIEDVSVYPVKTLSQLYKHLIGEQKIAPLAKTLIKPQQLLSEIDMSEIYGQEQAKRAVEISASGNHNLLLSGPPGSGKSMLAKALTGLLPPPSLDESLEITKLHSLTGLATDDVITARPYRNPHHTASNIALIGGGQSPKPGEISLAHRGVLFLDELPEFHRNALEVLRQPLEEGTVTISRANSTQKYPAKFLLVAAQNPCPCGYAGDADSECTCTPYQVQKYSGKISGPLLDRIDLIVKVERVKKDQLINTPKSENSESIIKRVDEVRKIQRKRYKDDNIKSNNEMNNSHIRKYCQLGVNEQNLMEQALSKLKLSARAYMRILKVSRTIADMDESEKIEVKHLAEAIQYRA